MYDFHVDQEMMPHPVIVKVRQVAPNQISIKYDQPTDLKSATTISNYWIRGNGGPDGVASLGMLEALTKMNTIQPSMGTITPIGNSKRRFIMTFRESTMSGVQYIVLPCFVNLEGRTGYGGANWGPYSRNCLLECRCNNRGRRMAVPQVGLIST